MHRSGTSYLAQTLSFMGLELPNSIQPGSPDNLKGHFESLKITQFHDNLLNELNFSWDTFIFPPESWFSSEYAERSIQELTKNFQREFPGSGPILLKDPRLSLFLPLWKKFVGITDLEDFYIVPLRHPLEVVASLDKRNKIGASRSCLIWLNYLFNAEKYSRGEKRSFIHFPEWSQDLEQTIDKIEHDIGTDFPKKHKKNLVKAKKEFEQSLVHHECKVFENARNNIESLCFESYRTFLKLTKDSSDAKALAKIDALRTQFEELSDVYAEVVVELEMKYGTQMQDSQHEREQAVAQAGVLQQRLDETEGHVTQLEQQMQSEKKSISDLQRKINELKVQNRSLSKEYEQLLKTHNKEQLTVVRPMYRNFYKTTGLLLRKTLPSAWVESIKKITPHPDGVPKQLTYQPQISKNFNASTVQFTPPCPESDPDIFVLSIINWDFRYQRPQHIAKGMADSGRRVFYVEMELANNGSQLTRVSDNLYRARLSSQNIGHIQPYTGQPDPEQTRAWVTAFYEFCNTIKATTFKQIIIQHPYWWQLAQHLSLEFQIIFDCMDNISGFSNTEQFLLDLEQDMLQKCDKLVVSSQYLFDKYKHFQTPVLIRNAAELNHFYSTRKEKLPPSFLKLRASKKRASNTIKVGYVGVIAEWFDAELVKDVAILDPSFEFHLCGAVTTQEAAQLIELENINMYGEIPYSDVPGFLHEMDVLIIPFKIIPIIQACDPVKFYEYSAMGKPTVTTALPELSRASRLTFFASTPTVFAEQIHNAYKAGKKHNFCKQLQEYTAKNTWVHRTAQFEEVLSKVPKVSIVILSYGDPDLTKAALHSLYDGGAAYPNMEVLVVDNGSPSNALEEVNQFAINYSNVKVIENGENLGFAKGNNVGLEAATGEHVMLLNNDTVVAPGAIYAMVRHLGNNPAIGAVGPLTNNIGNEAKLFVDYENMEQMKDIARQAATGYRGVFTPINVVAYFAVMFRRADLKTFGLLSEEYGRGMFEDDDHCAMIRSKGFICALAEDAYVHHHLSATFSKLKDEEKEALFESNKKIFEKKWKPWQPHKYRENRPESSLANGV